MYLLFSSVKYYYEYVIKLDEFTTYKQFYTHVTCILLSPITLYFYKAFS